ncbi:MAG: septum formation initiator family protein [Clostridia bacterium]|nr:septum formation initiator family protein [Clostridia bacterium]
MAKQKQKAVDIKQIVLRMLFIGFVLYALYHLATQQVSMIQKQKTVKECESMISAAKAENARLNEELELVNTDEYKEQKARELLGYVKGDERIYIDVTK